MGIEIPRFNKAPPAFLTRIWLLPSVSALHNHSTMFGRQSKDNEGTGVICLDKVEKLDFGCSDISVVA